MAVNKNFVVKNGLEVNNSLIVANAETQKVGIASTTPQYTLDVSGGIGVTDLYVTGVGTFKNDVFVDGNLNVTGDLTYDEVNGRNLRITGLSTFVGISTFESDVWIAGDLNVTGDITYDEVSGRNIIISGLSTFVGFSTFHNDLYVAGVVTATSFHGAFYGDGTNLTGIATGLSASLGVSEEGTFIGAGNTIINFVSTNGAAWNVTSVNGIATATVTPGVSLGLAIALGG
tara:strand:+ start:2068 stop:2757 length:690 start_codon:yes stop_codon:yes gene_type:complete